MLGTLAVGERVRACVSECAAAQRGMRPLPPSPPPTPHTHFPQLTPPPIAAGRGHSVGSPGGYITEVHQNHHHTPDHRTCRSTCDISTTDCVAASGSCASTLGRRRSRHVEYTRRLPSTMLRAAATAAVSAAAAAAWARGRRGGEGARHAGGSGGCARAMHGAQAVCKRVCRAAPPPLSRQGPHLSSTLDCCRLFDSSASVTSSTVHARALHSATHAHTQRSGAGWLWPRIK